MCLYVDIYVWPSAFHAHTHPCAFLCMHVRACVCAYVCACVFAAKVWVGRSLCWLCLGPLVS